MIINTITEAKAQLSALIETALTGEDVIIKKAGKPVAVLRKYDTHRVTRHSGALKGQIEISDDFDELPSDIESAFGMK
jgi:prevent-host-death family protein